MRSSEFPLTLPSVLLGAYAIWTWPPLQGLVLDCEALDFSNMDSFGELPPAGEPTPLWVALDEVSDPVRSHYLPLPPLLPLFASPAPT